MGNSITIKHFGKVVNGERIYYNKPLHKEAISELEGQEFEEIIKLRSKRVSTDAHGYYRGGILGECLKFEMFKGWERDEIHDHFVSMFLSYTSTEKRLVNSKTVFVETIKKTSTASLNSKEMFEYCERCIQWCAENGIVIHPPEHYLLGKYKTYEKNQTL